jgi:hypothetical protein
MATVGEAPQPLPQAAAAAPAGPTTLPSKPDEATIAEAAHAALTAALGAGADADAAALETAAGAAAEGALRRLAALRLPYKFAVTAHAQRRAGAGLAAAAAARRGAADGVVVVEASAGNVTAVAFVVYAAI